MLLWCASSILTFSNDCTQAHIDPSIIIDTPIPFKDLCSFVAQSLACNVMFALVVHKIMTSETTRGTDGHGQSVGILNATAMIGISTIMTHLIYILCGIHPTMLPLHTLASAFYLTLNMFIPVLLFMPTNYIPNQQYLHDNNESYFGIVISNLKRVSSYILGPMAPKVEQSKKQQTDYVQQKDQHRIQCIHQYTALGTLVGMAACAILRVLDHGIQIQRWPMPIIIGAVFGRCGGVCIGALMAMFSPSLWN